MNRFSFRRAFSFYVFMLCARWEINEMFSRLYIKKFLACIALGWLISTVYMFQNGGIVAGIYMLALGVSPALVFLWLVTHAPKKEGEK